MKAKYELMVIISSNITDEEIQKRLKGLKDFLGSEVVYEEHWGVRPFAYPIKKEEKGYYMVWNFLMTADEVRELKENMKLYPDLLRSLVMKVPDDYEPITLKEVEAGLEKLRQEKAEKREGRHAKKKTDKPAAKPATAKTEKAAPAKDSAEADKKPADDSNKTLDEKLDDILSDADLGL